MLLLSKYPIDAAQARSFQRLEWSAIPGARRPVDPATGRPIHSDGDWRRLRLSSKSPVDGPVRTRLVGVRLLDSHPTRPAFGGQEKRNVLRIHDEIRLWHEYPTPAVGQAAWLCDEVGRCGGLDPDARFVILGDLNNDP